MTNSDTLRILRELHALVCQQLLEIEEKIVLIPVFDKLPVN